MHSDKIWGTDVEIITFFLKCLVLTYSYLISTLIPEEKNAIQRGIDIVPTTQVQQSSSLFS